MKIRLKVFPDGEIKRLDRNGILVTGSFNFVKLEVEFPSTWSGLNHVVFSNEEHVIKIPYANDPIFIPVEMLSKDANEFAVSCFSIYENFRATSEIENIKLVKSGIYKNTNTQEITPTDYELISTICRNTLDVVNSIDWNYMKSLEDNMRAFDIEFTNKANQYLNELLLLKNNSILEIASSKNAGLNQIIETTNSGLSQIETEKRDAISVILENKNDSIVDIVQEKSNSINKIDTHTIDKINVLNMKTSNSVNEIETEKRESILAVETKKVESLNSITSLSNQKLNELQNANEDLDLKLSSSISSIETIKTTSINEINTLKDNALSQINVEKNEVTNARVDYLGASQANLKKAMDENVKYAVKRAVGDVNKVNYTGVSVYAQNTIEENLSVLGGKMELSGETIKNDALLQLNSTINPEVTTFAKNKFDFTKITKNALTVASVLIAPIGENYIKIEDTKVSDTPNYAAYVYHANFEVNLKKGKKYRLSYDVERSHPNTVFSIKFWVIGTTALIPVSPTSVFNDFVQGGTFEALEDIPRCRVAFYANRGTHFQLGAWAKYSNIQIEEVPTTTSPATPFEPYKEKVNNYNCTLRKVGNVADTLDLRTGVITRRIGERVYQNGDESNTNLLTDFLKTQYVLETPITETIEVSPIYSYDTITQYRQNQDIQGTLNIDVPTKLSQFVASLQEENLSLLETQNAIIDFQLSEYEYNLENKPKMMSLLHEEEFEVEHPTHIKKLYDLAYERGVRTKDGQSPFTNE